MRILLRFFLLNILFVVLFFSRTYKQRLYRRKPGMAAVASKLPQNLVKNRYRDISACRSIRLYDVMFNDVIFTYVIFNYVMVM